MRCPGADRDSRLDLVEIRGRYAVHYDITLPLRRITAAVHALDTEIGATYETIRTLMKIANKLSKDESGFIRDLCDKAFDAVNPTIF